MANALLRPGVGDRAPSITLPDHSGRLTALAPLWEDRPLALVFLRHFGCMHCRAHAMQLRRDRHKLARAGLQVIMVGLGTPAKAQAFRDDFDLSFTILADPDKSAYAAFGLSLRMNVLTEFLDPQVIAHTIARTASNGVALTAQDMFQLGGDFVIDTAGTIRYAYRGLRAADYTATHHLIDALNQ